LVPQEEKTTIIGTPKLRVPHEEQSKLHEARFQNEKKIYEELTCKKKYTIYEFWIPILPIYGWATGTST
jgi:hypothetical protein